MRGLFDRLLDDRPAHGLADAVARDLEDLLNTRTALSPELLQAYPECARSVLNYGLADFAGYSIASNEDQARVCANLRTAIARHEPRLRNVQVQLVLRPGTVNRIDLVISGALAGESARFEAFLQPSSLHYTIQRGAKA